MKKILAPQKIFEKPRKIPVFSKIMQPKAQSLVALPDGPPKVHAGGVPTKEEAARRFLAAKHVAVGLLAGGIGKEEAATAAGVGLKTVGLWLEKLIEADYNLGDFFGKPTRKRDRPVSADERVHARLKAELQPASKKDPGCLMRAAHASIVINPIPGIGCPARDTLHRALKEMGWGKLWRWGRIVLTDEMKRQRLAWCRRYRGTDWTKWVISDEKMWEKGKVLRRLLGKFYCGINNKDYTDVLQLELIPLIQKHAKDVRSTRGAGQVQV